MPPVRLDPTQRIVNVRWGGGEIVVLEFSFRRGGPRPPFTLSGLPFTSATYDLFAGVIVNNDGSGNPAIDNPITGAMLQRLRLWNRTPYFTSDEGGNRGNALVFFNLGRIKAGMPQGSPEFSFKIATPASSSITTTSVEYWVWSNAFGAGSLEQNEENPFTTGDPRFPPFGVIVIPTAFDTAGEAGAFAGLFSAPPMFVTSRIASRTRPDGLRWNLRVTSYRGRRNFPSGPANTPDWLVEEAIGGTVQSAAGSDPPIPAYEVTVRADTRTLAISAEKV
jgi:hypothetical protein